MVEHAHPDGRHAQEEGRLLGHRKIADGGPVKVPARQDELGPHQGRRIGSAPGVGVVHLGTGQDGVYSAETEAVRLDDRHGVQHGRAVRVEHALWIARGPRGVAEGRGLPLVEFRPVELRFGGDQDVFVDKGPGGCALREVPAVR